MKKELQVAAIQNGTVIDHIPNNKLFEVIRLLHLDEINESSIMVGYNLESKKMGRKSLIKISNRFFTDSELNQLAVVAPNVSLSVIKDFSITQKKCVEIPDKLVDIIKCPNPKCITNNEPMSSIFYVSEEDHNVLTCHYCEKEIELDTSSPNKISFKIK